MTENTDLVPEESCRACLTNFSSNDVKQKPVSIFEKVYNKNNINGLHDFFVYDAFRKINVQIDEKDVLPKYICHSCLKSLKDAYNFRELCILSKEKYMNKIERFNNVSNIGETHLLDNDGDEFEILNANIAKNVVLEKDYKCTLKAEPEDRDTCTEQIFMEYDDSINVKEKDEIVNIESPTDLHSEHSTDFQRKSEDINDCDYETDLGVCYQGDSDKDPLQSTSYRELNYTLNDEINNTANKKSKVKLKSIVEKNKINKINRTIPPSLRSQLPLNGIVFYSKGTFTKQGIITKCSNCCKYIFTSRVKVHEISCRYVLNELGTKNLPVIDNNDKYTCFYCNEEFKDISTIQSHISTKHDEEKPFKCEFCSKLFPRYPSCSRHVKCHKYNPKYLSNKEQKSLESIATYTGETYTEYGSINKCNNCYKFFMSSRIKLHETSCKRYLKTLGEGLISDDSGKYTCFYCCEEFEEIDVIEDHITKKHDKENPFFCKFCDKVFSHYTTYSIHLESHNNKLSTIECKFCGKYYTAIKLKKHMVVHDTSEKECEKCGKTFMNTERLKAHIRTHLNPYKCMYCQKIFANSFHLKNHERIHTGERPYACHICDKKFKIRNVLLVHIYKHSNAEFNCNFCEKGFTSSEELKKHLHRHEVHDYQCEYCGQLLPTVKLYQEHKQIHEDPEKVIVKPKVKAKQKSRYIKPAKKYKCSFCGDEFRLPIGLEKHSKMHDPNRPFPCNMCTRAYTLKRHLQQHISKDHLNEAQYPCLNCSRVFKDTSARNQHMVHVHKVSGDLYKCDLCSKKFQSHKNLEKHHKTHSPNICLICGKEYSTKYVLLYHIHEKHPEQEDLKSKAEIVKKEDFSCE